MDTSLYSIAAEIEDVHWWFKGRRDVLQTVLDYYLPSFGRMINILEVGCGNGGNLPLLSKYGKVYATEMDNEARLRATQREIAEVKSGSLPDNLPFNNLMFDVIAALDVLEHIDDDQRTIDILYKKLNPGGLLILTVPAYQQLWGVHDELCHHKRRYNCAQVISIVERGGFEVEYKSYFNTLLFPLALLNILISRVFKSKSNFALKIPSSIINSILAAFFSFESRMIPQLSLPWGMSVLVCARAYKK